MSDVQIKTPVHRTTALLKDKLTAQDEDIWIENGTPDYTSTKYCALVSGDSLTSKKTFFSGVLTFYAYAADWTDVIMGFRLADGENEVIYEEDAFVSEANNLTPVSSPAVLADGTAYYFKIIWCSQFISIDVWTLAGVLTASAKHRNPTNRAMPLYFTTITADELRIANLNLQEADDPVFFLDDIGHVNCQIEPRGGATWFWSGTEWVVLVNANNEVVGFRAGLPAGYSEFKVTTGYTGGNMNNTSLVGWGNTAGAVYPEFSAVNPFPSPTAFGGAFNKYETADSGWLSYNGLASSMWGYILRTGVGTSYFIDAWVELR